MYLLERGTPGELNKQQRPMKNGSTATVGTRGGGGSDGTSHDWPTLR